MKLVLFETAASERPLPGALTDRGIVPLDGLVVPREEPQRTVEALIGEFDRLRPALEQVIADSDVVAIDAVRLIPPLPRPGKILACIGNYWEHAQREARELNMYLKNPDSVIGPGATIELPRSTEPWIFMHEAELALVLKGPAKDVAAADWRDAVFGYTCLVDVSARGAGRVTWKGPGFLGKSFDTFCPIGPCIVTADEIPEPNALVVRLWDDGQLRHDYSTDDMEHRVPELIEFATSIMTMRTGDVISCGTNHEGLGPIQDGELIEIEIESIGRMQLSVSDPLRRQWDKGIYLGRDSTNRAVAGRGENSS